MPADEAQLFCARTQASAKKCPDRDIFGQIIGGLTRNIPFDSFSMLSIWDRVDIPARESPMTYAIQSTETLGALIRRERKAQGLRQPDLAAAAGTSIRFIVQIENGKATAQIGKVLDVLQQLGLGIELSGLTEEC